MPPLNKIYSRKASYFARKAASFIADIRECRRRWLFFNRHVPLNNASLCTMDFAGLVTPTRRRHDGGLNFRVPPNSGSSPCSSLYGPNLVIQRRHPWVPVFVFQSPRSVEQRDSGFVHLPACPVVPVQALPKQHISGLRYGPANRGARGPDGRAHGVHLVERLGRGLHARRADRAWCRRPAERGCFQRTLP